KASHSVTDRRPVDAGTNTGNNAGTFETKGRPGKSVDQRLFGQQPHRPHHVAEIEAGRAHLDLYLARTRRFRIKLVPAKRVESTRPIGGKRDRMVGRNPTRRQATAKAGDVTTVDGPDYLSLIALAGQLRQQQPRLGRRIRSRRQVD